MLSMKSLAFAGLALISLHISSFGAGAAVAETISKVADGIYLFAPGDGYTSMFVVTSEGVVAIEPVNTDHAEGQCGGECSGSCELNGLHVI